MAARKKKIKLTDAWRDKIQVGYMLDRLIKCFKGEVILTPEQLKAADMVLKKVVPDLSRAELTGKDDKPIEIKNVTQQETLDFLKSVLNAKNPE